MIFSQGDTVWSLQCRRRRPQGAKQPRAGATERSRWRSSREAGQAMRKKREQIGLCLNANWYKGTSKNLAPAASTRCVAPSGAWLFVIHTSLILGRILRFSILPLSRLVRTKNTHACHPFEVLRSTLIPFRSTNPPTDARLFFRRTIRRGRYVA